jgi:nitroreductase
MSGEKLAPAELMKLFEAARWAPSSGNNQPWRFVYAHRDSPHWDRLFGLLVQGNQVWCKNAGALVVVLSKDTRDFDGKPARTHSFDTGAAWCSLALQGTLSGLVVHGMEGFDYDRAKTELGVPHGYSVECMIAVGKPGNKEDLPEKLRAREEPSTRKPLPETVFEGAFPASKDVAKEEK